METQKYFTVDASFATNKIHLIIQAALDAKQITINQAQFAKVATLLIEAVLMRDVNIDKSKLMELLNLYFEDMQK